MAIGADLVHATHLQVFAFRVKYAENAVLQYHWDTDTLQAWFWLIILKYWVWKLLV